MKKAIAIIPQKILKCNLEDKCLLQTLLNEIFFISFYFHKILFDKLYLDLLDIF